MIGIGSGVQEVVLTNSSSLILALFLQNQTQFVGAITRMVLSLFLARVLNRRHYLVSRHSCSSCECISGPLSIRRTKVQGEVTFFETVVIGLSATITSNDNWDDLNRESHWVSCFTTHSDLLLPP